MSEESVMRRADDKDKDKLNNAEGADPKYAAPRIFGVGEPEYVIWPQFRPRWPKA